MIEHAGGVVPPRVEPDGAAGGDHIQKLQEQFLAEREQFARSEILAMLSQHYLAQKRPHLAYLCLIESLRHAPLQTLSPLQRELAFYRPAWPSIVTRRRNRCLVSVIVPTYNRPDELAVCLESVLKQTIHNWEAIVVNDGGCDEARKVVGSFRSDRIVYINLKRNSGLPAARNAGLRAAAGKYIAYLDDDDIFYPEHLRIVTDCLESRPWLDVAYSNAWWVDGEFAGKTFIPHQRTTHPKRPAAFDVERLFTGNYISTLNLVHRRRVLERTGLFHEELPKLEDWDFLLRLAMTCRFMQVNRRTGEYRWKGNNISISGKSEMLFWTSILNGFYCNFQGLLPLAAYHFSRGEHGAVGVCLSKVLRRYDLFHKKEDSVAELLHMALSTRSIPLYRRAVRDYFKLAPRKCLAYLRDLHFIRPLVAICPLLPFRVVRSLLGRLRQTMPHRQLGR